MDLSNQLNSIASNISFYFTIIIFPIGILLNCLCIIVSFRYRLNQGNLGFFIKCVSTSNILIFLFSIFTTTQVIGVDPSTVSDASCKLIIYFRRLLREVYPCVEVLFCLDRYLSIAHPHRFKTFMNPKNKAMWMLVFGGLLPLYLIANIGNLFYSLEYTVTTSEDYGDYGEYGNITYNDVNVTVRTCEHSSAAVIAADFVVITLRSFIPITLMLTFNTIIRRKLVSSSLRANTNQTESRDRSFTRTLFKINIAFIMFYLPEALGYIVLIVFTDLEDSSQLTQSIANLVFIIGINFSMLYNTGFFFVNLRFNKLFRSECSSILWTLLPRRFLRRLSTRISVITNQSSNNQNAVEPVRGSF